MKAFNLDSLLDVVYQQVIKLVDDQAYKLCLEMPFSDETVNIKKDETKVIQVLTNLLNNAIKFTS